MSLVAALLLLLAISSVINGSSMRSTSLCDDDNPLQCTCLNNNTDIYCLLNKNPKFDPYGAEVGIAHTAEHFTLKHYV